MGTCPECGWGLTGTRFVPVYGNSRTGPRVRGEPACPRCDPTTRVARNPAGKRPRYAIVGSVGRRRRLGACAIPAPYPAVADVPACPRCGGAMTGWRPSSPGLRYVGNLPRCYRCDPGPPPAWNRAGRWPKDALPGGKRHAARLARQRAEEPSRPYDSEPTADPPPTPLPPLPKDGRPLRQRLAERNLAMWAAGGDPVAAERLAAMDGEGGR